jgi:hypothetical protein
LKQIVERGFLVIDICFARCARGCSGFIGKFVGFVVSKPMCGKAQGRSGLFGHVGLDFDWAKKRGCLSGVVSGELVAVMQSPRQGSQ